VTRGSDSESVEGWVGERAETVLGFLLDRTLVFFGVFFLCLWGECNKSDKG
jgi:hypothetical protein